MSLPASSATRIPGRSGSLCALLALLLLTPPRPLASGGPLSVVRELRCRCLSITPKVHPQMITHLEVTVAGPQCPNVELIATLKNGKEVCLDPEAPLVKKIIQKILSSRKQKN